MMNTASADNAIATLSRLLKVLGVKVTSTTVRRTLEGHPEFPALSSMSDALDRWRLANVAFRLETVEQLRELPLPFVVHQEQQGGWFRLITRIEGNQFTYWDSNEGAGQQSLESFEKAWSGVVLIAETNDDSGESDYVVENRKERLNALRRPVLYTLTIFLLTLILSILLPSLTLLQGSWLLTKTLGLTLSIALLAKQLGRRNALVDRLCRVSTKSNCQSLLDSPAAKLWGWLGWAEICTLYFAGGLCVAFVSSNPLLGWLALGTLPYTIFSVYYQARVARIWCPLCLGVQAILLAEGILSFIGPLMPVTLIDTIYAAMGFTLPLLGWLLVRPALMETQTQREEHQDLMVFKRSTTIFRALLHEQEAMPALPGHLRSLRLGQPDAAHILTIVTNPYCGPCAQKHKELDALLRLSPAIAVRVIFLTSEIANDKITRLAQHLLTLDTAVVPSALTVWFAQSSFNYEAWARHFPLSVAIDDARQTAIEHGRWCWDAGITSTPTVFLDGYRFPDPYRLTDVGWFLTSEVELPVSLS